MSKELKNITDTIMGKIKEGDVKMKPKMYFVMGSVFTFMGLVLSLSTSIFLIGLLRFSIRSHGPMKEYRLEQLLDSFSWWVPVIAVVSLFVGVWLLKKYDFSYKKNYTLLVIGVIVAVIFTGIFIDSMGVHERLSHKGHMKGMMKGYGDGKYEIRYGESIRNR